MSNISPALWVVLAGAGLALSCGMAANSTELYDRGTKEARARQWEPATSDLEAFARKACGGARPDKRCRQAHLTLARAYEQRGSAARAWVALDTALAMAPHQDDAKARDDLARLEQQLREQPHGAGGRGPVMVRYRDEMTDEFTARSLLVAIDFRPVHARNHGAGDLRSPDFTQLWSGSLPAGDHVLVVEAAHACKPGVAAHCAASQVHRSWSFTSEPRTPAGLDVRAIVEPGLAQDSVRPALEMSPH
ncbi:MAG TPA: hypothetical protein VFH68_05740 [Polyangia bacterium]|nr:hypothetical protein [Polyangia bacterium]